MKIAPAQIDAFVKKPAAARAILLFGPDEGVIRSHRLSLTQHYLGTKFNTMDITEIQADSLSEDPAKLSDALSSFSLLGGNQLVVLRSASGDEAKLLKEVLLGNLPPVWPLIVLSGELRPTSPLRKLFEAEKELAAIACYADETKKITQILAEEFRNRGISCEQGVIPLLAATLGNDRAITLQEIEKIDLYLGEERHLSAQAVQLLAGDNREHTLDELFHAICAAQGSLEVALNHCFLEGLQPIGIYRMLSGHLQKLLGIKALLASGMAQKAAFMRYGVFFKSEPLIARQLQCWNEAGLKRALTLLLEAEQENKRGSISAEMICRHTLFKLRLFAGGAGNRRAA